MNAYNSTAPEATSAALVRNSIMIGAASGALAIILTAVSVLLGALAFGADFAIWASVAILAGAGLVIAYLLISAWQNARWVLVETIAANIEKTRAEAQRIEAEADAIAGANTAIIQNVNAGDGAKVKANITAPRVRVNGRDVSWGQINQLNQIAPEPRRVEIPRQDVLWMLEQFINAGHSRRVFERETLPYSQIPAYPDAYRALIAALVEGHALVGRGERAAGRLVVKDVAELAQIVDAAHPRGLVLELPPTLESGN